MGIHSKSIITASLVLPLFLMACERSEKSPPATGTSQDSLAVTPSPPPVDQATEKSPPSPADLSRNPAAPTEPAPVDQKTEPKPAN